MNGILDRIKQGFGLLRRHLTGAPLLVRPAARAALPSSAPPETGAVTEAAFLEAEAAREKAQGLYDLLDRLARSHRDLVDGLPIALATTDAEGHVCEWNPAAAAAFVATPAHALARPLWEVVRPVEEAESFRGRVVRALATGKAQDVTIAVERPLFGTGWFNVRLFPIFDPQGRVTGVVMAAVDITAHRREVMHSSTRAAVVSRYADDLVESNRRLEALALTDGLTGLLNHRAFYERLAAALVDTQGPVAVMLVDVDQFKSFNDRFGHVQGDIALRAVADVLRAQAPAGCSVARYGGEEFGLVLPGADPRTADCLAERIRREVEASPWPLDPVTVSVGYAVRWPGGPGDVSQMVDRADQALYVAKAAGRNCVRASGFGDRESVA